MTSRGVDVVIAGGGVVGHATAWELARRDIEVLIVDRPVSYTHLTLPTICSV